VEARAAPAALKGSAARAAAGAAGAVARERPARRRVSVGARVGARLCRRAFEAEVRSSEARAGEQGSAAGRGALPEQGVMSTIGPCY
jgi:hypothetical protein